jgi:hypothetical protein
MGDFLFTLPQWLALGAGLIIIIGAIGAAILALTLWIWP